MPLVRLSAATANQNLRRRPSLWPDGRVPTDRLDGVAKVALQGSFTFSTADRIMTIGSCFAREIEKRLAQLGFDLPMLQLALPQDERASSSANDMVNKYTVHSIVNEFAWAFGELEPPPPEQLFLQAGEDLWLDPHLIHNMAPAPLARAIERRAMVRAAIAELPSCRIVVVTLGLAESWYDHLTGLYLNAAPPAAAIRFAPDRFSLDLLAYDDILEALEHLHRLLKAHGHPEVRLLITVSPVPFKATFTGGDAISANTYSKAVQRAACEAFVRRHDDVDYFPSFEIVTHTNRELAYEKDNIHVAPTVVAQIMDRVVERYAPDLAFARQAVEAPRSRRLATGVSKLDLQRNAKYYFAEQDYEKASGAYRGLVDNFVRGMGAAEEGQLRLDYGVALLRSRRTAEGVKQIQRAVTLTPEAHRAFFKLGLGLARLHKVQPSINAFRRAIALEPTNAAYHTRLALSLDSIGQKDEAAQLYRRALDLDPENREAMAALGALQAVG